MTEGSPSAPADLAVATLRKSWSSPGVREPTAIYKGDTRRRTPGGKHSGRVVISRPLPGDRSAAGLARPTQGGGAGRVGASPEPRPGSTSGVAVHVNAGDLSPSLAFL